MKRIIFGLLFAILLTSCSKAEPTPDPALFSAQTEVASAQTEIGHLQGQLEEKEVTLVYLLGQYHWLQSATPATILREVTPTFTPTPKYTPTITNTPEPTNTSTSTPDKTKTDKRDGSYMVGSEIAAGIWRSSGGDPNDECWISIKSFSGNLIDIAGDLPGGTIRVPDGDYIVYIGGGSGNKCVWTFISP